MTDPFPGTVEPHRIPPFKEPAKTQLTTLANGFRVASEDAWVRREAFPLRSMSLCVQGTTSGIGLAVAAGSQNESQATSGASHFLEYMAFRGSHHRTHFRIMHELNGYGAHTAVSASREQMYYSIECLKSDTAAAVEVLCDAVMNPRFNSWEVEEVQELVKSNLDELKKNPQSLLGELLIGAVYQGGLGHPLISPAMGIDRLDSELLRFFHGENFTPERMVLSVAGIDHDTLLQIAEPIAGILPKGGPYAPPHSTYVGGEIKKPEEDPLCHLVLAFDVEVLPKHSVRCRDS